MYAYIRIYMKTVMPRFGKFENELVALNRKWKMYRFQTFKLYKAKQYEPYK